MNATKTLLTILAIPAFLPAQAQMANRFDVVITEIMADPTPVVGLPNAEYVEIKNRSSAALPLNGWKFSTKSTTVTLTTPLVLQPDSLLVLCANSNVTAFSAYGRTLGVTSFPALNNDGDLLTLRSPQNKTIHAVEYSIDWYQNKAKSDGGWSLEMIDPANPCTGKDNWKACINAAGGTPGTVNSVNAANPDKTPPQLKRAFATDSVSLQLVFDEPLDSTSAAMVSNYQLQDFVISTAIPLAPLFQTVQVKLATPLAARIYDLTVTNLTDCQGNSIGSANKIKTGLPQPAAPADVVVNEILFNPKPNGFDYVEFFNRSKKIIDLANLYVTNRTNTGAVGSLKKIAAEPLYLFPGDYLVLTEEKEALQRQYLVKNEEAVLQLSSLPSLPDDKGTVLLQAINGDIIDEVSYHKSWHFALLDDPEGIALERIDPDGPSQQKSNWHSAASTAGYGTPTYRNSQYKTAGEPKAMITVLPSVFSPDNDGRDDLATISYQVEESGYVANVFIFDASGRLVRQLVKNDLLALKGSWVWDGLGEKNNKLPIGTYIVFTEIFNLEGKKKSFKQTIVLARRLN